MNADHNSNLASPAHASLMLGVAFVLLLACCPARALGASYLTTQFDSTDVPKYVPLANGSPAISNVTVSGITGPVTKVKVSVYVPHSWPWDVELRLIGPDTTTVVLTKNLGGTNGFTYGNNWGSSNTGYGSGSAQNEMVTFSNEAGAKQMSTGIVSGLEVYYLAGGTYVPLESLTAFNGKTGANVNGNWKLYAADNYPDADVGNLLAWSLIIEDLDSQGGYVWTGAGADNHWSTVANWEGGFAPPNDTTPQNLIFPADPLTQRFSSINDIPGLQIYSLRVSGNVSGNYAFGGNAITLIDGGTFTVTDGITTSSMNIALAASATISVGADTCTMSGIISGGAAGTTLTKTGAGTLVLSAANTYAAQTEIAAGVLQITNLAGLGVTNGGTAVTNGGTLQLIGGLTMASEPLTLNGLGSNGMGALSSVGANTWNGPITLGASGGSVGAEAGGTMNVNCVLSGGDLATQGAGTVNLNSVLPAGLAVNAGTANLNSALSANLAVNAGTANLLASNLISDTATVAVTGGGTLNLGAFSDTIASLNLTGGATSSSTVNTGTGAGLTVTTGVTTNQAPTTAVIMGAGGLVLTTTAARPFTVADGTAAIDLDVQTVVKGAGGIAKSGPGTMLLSGVNTYTGGITVSAGTLLVGATATILDVTVSGGTLGGTGTVGAINATGGTVNPGTPTANGILTCSSATFGANAAFAVDLGGGTSDQLAVTGVGLTLGNATLKPYLTGAAGTFVIINNSVATIVDQFNGQPEGSGITYVGGDGNDVALILNGTTFAFSAATYTVNELAGTVTITVVQGGLSAGGTVVYATSDGTAVAPTDYTATTNTLTFTAGQASQTFTVPIIHNNVNKGPTTVHLALVPGGGAALGSQDTATLTITEGDTPPEKKQRCGLGTGFAVFLLFGFGLFLLWSRRW